MTDLTISPEQVRYIICLQMGWGPEDAETFIKLADPNQLATDRQFGVCPECGKTDGYLNTGRTHVFMCKTHRTSWVAGANLFSDWRHETEAEQLAKWDEIGMEDFERMLIEDITVGPRKREA